MWLTCARNMRDRLYRVKPFECPAHLRANHRSLTEDAKQQLADSLKTHYFSYTPYFPDPVPLYLSTEDGQSDLRAHLVGRERYNRMFKGADYEKESTRVEFARWGRGISYHDFALAFNVPAHELNPASCLELFFRARTHTERLYKNTPWRRYEEMLKSMRPDIHRGFYLKYLDLIFRKP